MRQLQQEGYVTAPEDLAHISPHLTEHIRRFGEYSTHELGLVSEAYDRTWTSISARCEAMAGRELRQGGMISRPMAGPAAQ
ncbi:hypothetical protein [Streptomyces sp. NPDC048527]|uniref:hypothetical protein n=1 Tax=Streptomyces sp. NPDC048527 TaxID=3365568 RepID=UPI003714DD77